MAEEAASEVPNQSAHRGGSRGILPALLVIVLMPVISFAMFKFMFIPMIKAEIPEPGEVAPLRAKDVKVEHATGGSPKHSYDFPDVVTNVKGTSQTRFVQVSFTVYSSHPDLEDIVESNEVKMKDVAISVLDNLTLADLERREIKNIVRNQLKQGFEHVMGEPIIEEIYFSQYVVQ